MKRGENVHYWSNPLNDTDEDVRTAENKNGPVPAKILALHGPHRADLQVLPEGKEKVLKTNVPMAKVPGCSSTFTAIK